MKIIETINQGEYGPDRIEIELITDVGSETISFAEGESEDMTLNRELSDAFNITSILKRAYDAGKKGEDLEIEYIEDE